MQHSRSEQGGPTTVSGSCDSSTRNGNRHGACSGTSHYSSASRSGDRRAREGQEGSQKASAALSRQTRGSKRTAPRGRGARSGTRYHQTYQVQKDGMSVTARRKKNLCTTRGVGEGGRIQAESSAAGAGGLGGGVAETCCSAGGMCKRGAGNRRRWRR